MQSLEEYKKNKSKLKIKEKVHKSVKLIISSCLSYFEEERININQLFSLSPLKEWEEG